MAEIAIDLQEQGRTDPVHLLMDRLPSAAPPYAEGALDNPALDPGIVEVMLRNTGLPGAFLSRIVQDKELIRNDTVKRAVVLHPSTPPALSMHLLQFLHLQDLIRVSDNLWLPQSLRNLSEQVMAKRLLKLSSLEKARLARTASRGIISAFLKSRDLQVVQELMKNPRLAERDLLTLARDDQLPPAVLTSIARNGKWACRPGIRRALVENRSTPVNDAIPLLEGLLARDLQEVVRNPRLQPALKTQASRALQKRNNGR